MRLHTAGCGFYRARIDGLQHPSGACDCIVGLATQIRKICTDEERHYDDLEAREELCLLACEALEEPCPLKKEQEWQPNL